MSVSVSERSRNIALDGFRGFAMLMIFVFHCVLILPTNTLDRAYLYLVNYSLIGMHFFFALSGFLITGILIDTKTQKGYFINFYARRFLRIVPLYYLLLVGVLLILPNFAHPYTKVFASIQGDEWSYWTFLCNFTIGRAGTVRHFLLNVAWSLAVEEQFYIVWPVVAAVLSTRRLLLVCFGILIGSVFYRLGMVLSGANNLAIYVSTFSRCDAIAAGSIIAIAHRHESAVSSWILRHANRLLTSSAVATFGLMMTYGVEFNGRPLQILGHGFVAILSGAILLNLTAGKKKSGLAQFFELGLFRTVGKYSYGIYLFHMPVMVVIQNFVYKPHSFLSLYGSKLPGQILFVLLTGSLALGVAYLSFHFFESPILSLKRYFEYSRVHSKESSQPVEEARAA